MTIETTSVSANKVGVDGVTDAAATMGAASRSLMERSDEATAAHLDSTRYLQVDDLAIFTEIALQGAVAKGAEFFSWKNAPELKGSALQHSGGPYGQETTRPITTQEALDIYATKLNGAYAERWLLAAAYIVSAVERGEKVALLQLHKEPGIPFDAAGWVVASINGYPMFHIDPKDLDMQRVANAGLITVVEENTPAARTHGWKGTNKVEEFGLLLRWALGIREQN